MNVVYNEGTRRTPEETRLLDRATVVVEEVVQRSAEIVKIEWGRAEDIHGRMLFLLRLSDWSGEVAGVFSEDDLKDLGQFRLRVSRIYDRQLGVRIDKHFAAAQAARE